MSLAPRVFCWSKKRMFYKRRKKGFRVCENDYWSEKCYLASIDDCKIKKGNLYNVCLLDEKSGKLIYADDKESFSPGQIIIIKVDLKKAMEEKGLKFDPYKVCSLSNFKEADVYVPGHYSHTALEDRKEGITCSDALDLKYPHYLADYTLVPDFGKINIVIRAWPANFDLSTIEKVKKNINQSKIIFAYEAKIK